MSTLIGPFKQALTFSNTSEKGPLQDENMDILRDVGVLLAGEKIAAVGNFESLIAEAEEVEEVAGEPILLPGLIDCHTHLVWGGTRSRDYTLRMAGASYEKILEQGGGIFDSVEKTRKASANELLCGLRERARRHLNDGVTTIEVKSGYGLNVKHELKILETIRTGLQEIVSDLVPTCLAAHVCPKEFDDKGEFLHYLQQELFPLLQSRQLTKRIDIFIEPTAFPVAIAGDYLRAAKEAGFDLTVHADQFHTGGSALAAELGAVSADHLEASSDEEISIIAASDTVAVALPGASLGLGMQFTPARKLLDKGASLAIATDWNPGSAPMGDLLVQAAILGMYEKLSSAEVFAGITFRAAKALGLSDRGRIAPGMMADLIAFACNDYREILYNQGKVKPSLVWKKGRRVRDV